MKLYAETYFNDSMAIGFKDTYQDVVEVEYWQPKLYEIIATPQIRFNSAFTPSWYAANAG